MLEGLASAQGPTALVSYGPGGDPSVAQVAKLLTVTAPEYRGARLAAIERATCYSPLPLAEFDAEVQRLRDEIRDVETELARRNLNSDSASVKRELELLEGNGWLDQAGTSARRSPGAPSTSRPEPLACLASSRLSEGRTARLSGPWSGCTRREVLKPAYPLPGMVLARALIFVVAFWVVFQAARLTVLLLLAMLAAFIAVGSAIVYLIAPTRPLEHR